MDDWEDEKKFAALGYGKILQRKNNRLSYRYPEKAEKIRKLLEELSQMEKAGETDIDKMSGCFGRIMEEIFAWKTDVWDDDVEKDVKNGNYNPFAEKYIMKGFDEQVRQLLIMMMAQTCREFEKLPIIKYTDILRNILYSGVWCRFEAIARKRREAGEKKHD